ncbi:MAG: amidohydrolase family protein [Gemmatimonadota bacterium]
MTTPMIPVDVSTFVGGFPYRHLAHPEPEALVSVLDRENVARAWVGHLPGAFHRDPGPSNSELFETLEPHRARLVPAPIVRPDWPGSANLVDEAKSRGCAAVRAYPQLWGLVPGDDRMRQLGERCASRKLALIFTVRFEDLRQRHTPDTPPDLSAAHVRELARQRTGVRIVVSAAGRDLVEEIHWGLTPEERRFVFYEISWIWGPPADDLSHLLRSVGADRFLYGSMWPLRLAELPRANLELLEADVQQIRLADPSAW